MVPHEQRGIAHHRNDAAADAVGVRIRNAGQIQDPRQEIAVVMERIGLQRLAIGPPSP
jgi:hypothetical protein